MRREAPSTSDEIIDSRDVIERIEELEGELESAHEALNIEPSFASWVKDQRLFSSSDHFDEATELHALKKLQDEAEGYAPDWRYGATLIREDHFTEYCQELLDDIGDLPKDLPGYIAIDWDKTADNLRVDYTEVDFDGTTYLVR